MSSAQIAIALNMASANDVEADMMLASMELRSGSELVDWPATFAGRENPSPERDGWHGIILASGAEIVYDGGRWTGSGGEVVHQVGL